MSELSASDVMAMMNNGENGWTNNPFIYLVWLALLGGGGGNGFFGNGNSNAATQGAITRSDLFEGFNNQDVNSQIRGLTSGLSDGVAAINASITNANANLNSAITNSSNAIQSSLCGIDRNIDSVKAEAYKNTCSITNAIHCEGEATRALIQANTIQNLRDSLEQANRNLLSANFQISQQAQNATIINALKSTSTTTTT